LRGGSGQGADGAHQQVQALHRLAAAPVHQAQQAVLAEAALAGRQGGGAGAADQVQLVGGHALAQEQVAAPGSEHMDGIGLAGELQPGASGSPVLNASGQVLGLVYETATYARQALKLVSAYRTSAIQAKIP
jgi:hypothetical protein